MQVSRTYLVKVINNLVRAGLVRSHRGAGGGYTLAKPKAEISLRTIVEASEGPIAFNACRHPAGCDREKVCGLYSAWDDVQAKLIEVMESYTLEDLSAPFRGLEKSRRSKVKSRRSKR
jgi:Rrf2 family protein